MLKKLFLGVLTFLVCGGLALAPADAKDIYVDSKLIINSKETIIEGKDVLVPLEKIVLSLPVELKRDEKNNGVIISNSDKALKLFFEKEDAYLNGNYVRLVNYPRFRDYYGYLVPVVSVSKSFYNNVVVSNDKIEIFTKVATEQEQANSPIKWNYSLATPTKALPLIDPQWNIIVPNENKLTWISPTGQKIKELVIGVKSNNSGEQEIIDTITFDKTGDLIVTTLPYAVGASHNLSRKIYKVNTNTGEKWQLAVYETYTDAGKEILSKASIDPNNDIVAAFNDKLYYVTSDKYTKWVVYTKGSIMNSPFLYGELVITVNGKTLPRLQAYKKSDGARKWTNEEASGTVIGEPIISQDGKIYMVTNSVNQSEEIGHIWIFKAENGQLLQKIALKDKAISGIFINGSEKALLTTGNIIVIDDKDNIKWQSKVSAEFVQPILNNKTVSVVQNKNQIIIYENGGVIKNTITLGANIVSLAQGPNDTLIATTTDGKIYCIKNSN